VKNIATKQTNKEKQKFCRKTNKHNRKHLIHSSAELRYPNPFVTSVVACHHLKTWTL